MNWIYSILYNHATKRWHPILFYPAPLPGGARVGATRYKSKGHHTSGFDSRAEAIGWCKGSAPSWQAKLCVDNDIPWDGRGTPALVVWFSEADGVEVEGAIVW